MSYISPQGIGAYAPQGIKPGRVIYVTAPSASPDEVAEAVWSYPTRTLTDFNPKFFEPDLLADKFGIQPVLLLREFLDKGATYLVHVLFDTPPNYIAKETTANFVETAFIRDKYGYVMRGYSSDGNDAYVDYWLLDISNYTEILTLMVLVPEGDSRGPYIGLGTDINNKYMILITIAASAKDFRIDKVVAGSKTIIVYEAVDLELGRAYYVSAYYNRDTGRFIVWRDGALKFDTIDTDINPTYLGIGYYTMSTSETERKVQCPIIVVAL